ncbi:MAG: T9SS type A sorting domain-containing protein [Bacteroidales bacterium]|nr:T9SS type A sorting domain-containing protein [Bacteroidales bacterium]
MKKTIAIAIAAFCCITANAQEINAVVTRQGTTNKNCYQLSSQPSVVFGEDNTITVKEGETTKEEYTLSESNTLTVLFGSAISNEVNAEDLEVAYPIYIMNNGKLTVSGTMANANAEDLVIEDGGQLSFDAGTANAIVKKTIAGYNDGNGNWYLVASPIASTDAPAGMIDETADNYDLYIFNQSSSDGLEWNNYKVQPFNIGGQNGYLYAHKNGTTLVFDGQLNPTANAKNLEYDGTAEFAGFNLIGNPFTCDAYIDRDFYRMNDEGTELIADVADAEIAPCEGVFVQAQGTGESVTFTPSATPATRSLPAATVALTLSQGRSAAAIDRAIVRLGEGDVLGKLMLNADGTRLYIPQNGKDYAAVSTNSSSGEIPVSFKAAKNGSYTITVNVENADLNYLHLVDNLTGNDVDLLGSEGDVARNVSTYTFDAKTSDYASRFKLVFGVKDETSEASENFAYISNGEIIVSNEGRATLQVIDVQGRIVSSEEINGECRISTNGLTAGVYILNLNGKTQKIVVE